MTNQNKMLNEDIVNCLGNIVSTSFTLLLIEMDLQACPVGGVGGDEVQHKIYFHSKIALLVRYYSDKIAIW